METPPPLTPAPAAPAVSPVTPPTPAPGEPALLKAQHNGGGWFFWIAGLSLVNSIAIHSGSNYNFIVGLGVTAVADTILHSINAIGHILAYLFDAIVLGVFVLFGYFARKGKIWAFVTGFVFYALDAVLYAVLPDSPEWLAIGFHAFVLFSIWGGMQAARKLKRAPAPAVV